MFFYPALSSFWGCLAKTLSDPIGLWPKHYQNGGRVLFDECMASSTSFSLPKQKCFFLQSFSALNPWHELSNNQAINSVPVLLHWQLVDHDVKKIRINLYGIYCTEICQKLDLLLQLSWADWGIGNSSGEQQKTERWPWLNWYEGSKITLIRRRLEMMRRKQHHSFRTPTHLDFVTRIWFFQSFNEESKPPCASDDELH